MQCPQCRHENPPQAKFCLECGARIALQCSRCGTELPTGARFCLECGQALSPSSSSSLPRFTSPRAYTPRHLTEKILTARTALEGERKQVTVLFADLKGSMELLADRDPSSCAPRPAVAAPRADARSAHGRLWLTRAGEEGCRPCSLWPAA